MEFEKGSKVEVMNKSEGATSWCVAEVVSGNNGTYNLRFDCCVEISKVSKEFIRPCPPTRPNDWVIGDIVEVLDDSCSWITATLVCKVSDGAHFSLRPHGLGYQIIVHKSNIRARQVWKHGQWLRLSKSHVVSSKKRASPFCSDVSPMSSNKKTKDDKQIISDSCSVASCSNGPYKTDLVSSGAKSSNAPKNVDENGGEDGSMIHGLELHAYRFTLDALYASGPLTWDKEALLTNLRINLHISNDEHLIHLRNLISTH